MELGFKAELVQHPVTWEHPEGHSPAEPELPMLCALPSHLKQQILQPAPPKTLHLFRYGSCRQKTGGTALSLPSPPNPPLPPQNISLKICLKSPRR